MPYATPDDLAGYVSPLPDDAVLLLVRAQRAVDLALRTAVYDTDDTEVQAALREATCEQAARMAEAGETGTGADGTYGQVSIGSVSLGRAGGSAAGARADALADQARAVLELAGLLGHAGWAR